MTRRRVLAAIVAIISIAVVVWRYVPSRVVKLYGGNENFETIAHPTEVDVCRRTRSPENPFTADVSPPRSLNSQQRQRLSTMLAASESYDWNMAKGCAITPGIRFDFRRRDQCLSVLVCFNCRMIGIEQNGKLIGSEDVDAIGQELLDLARALYPEDDQLRRFRFDKPYSAGQL